MLLSQWKNKLLVLSPVKMKSVLESRRAVRGLAKLLPLFEESTKVDITYDKLARIMGYKNRSGVWKMIKKLESLGVVAVDNDGYLRLTMEGIIIGSNE